MAVSDLTISVSVRMVLVRHRVDVQQLSFNSFRGTVRVNGRLVSLGTEDPITPGRIEAMESEIKRVHGVQRAFFDFTDWTKDEDGNWRLRDDRRRRRRKQDEAKQDGRQAG